MDAKTKKMLDSIRWVRSIDKTIEMAIEGLFIGERILYEDEIAYLIARREVKTNKAFRRGGNVIRREYEMIKDRFFERYGDEAVKLAEKISEAAASNPDSEI